MATIPTDLAQTAASQLVTAYIGFVDAMHDYFAANPTATQAAALAHLNGLAYPDTTASIQFTDRQALFTYLAQRVHPYAGQATAYASLRKLLLDHPKAFVRQIDKEARRPTLTVPERKLVEMQGRTQSGWDYEPTTDVIVTKTFHPTIKALQSRRWRSSTLGYDVTETWDVAIIDGKAKRTYLGVSET